MLLKEHPDARIISGGSDVLIKIREGRMAGTSLVSIRDIEEINQKVRANLEKSRADNHPKPLLERTPSPHICFPQGRRPTLRQKRIDDPVHIFFPKLGLPVHVIHRREPDFVPGLADSGPQGLYLPVATRPEADEAAFGNIKSKLPDTPDQDSGVLQFHCIGKCPDQDGEPDLLHLRDQHGRKKLTAEIQINHCRLNCFSERSRFLEPPFRFSKITPRTEISAHSAGNFQPARCSVRARFWLL